MIMMILSALVLPLNLHSNHFSVQAGKLFSNFFHFSSKMQIRNPNPDSRIIYSKISHIWTNHRILQETCWKRNIFRSDTLWISYLNCTLVQIRFIILLQAINLITNYFTLNKKSKFTNYLFQDFSSLNQSTDSAGKLLKEE